MANFGQITILAVQKCAKLPALRRVVFHLCRYHQTPKLGFCEETWKDFLHFTLGRSKG